MQKRLFSELGLSAPILKAVERLGFEETSPIQSAAIPALMAGRDIVGQSATGSGKTAAFAIPAIEKIEEKSRRVEVVVLVPTRELAAQVAEEFARLAHFRPQIHAVPIYGGTSYERQFQELRKGPQIIIGTPGRVIDHLERNTLDLSHVKFAVLDECDRMLDMGFRDDMERILSAVPKDRQTAFFSATLPPPIKKLIDEFGREPEHIRIEAQAMTVPTVEQVYFEVPPRGKLDALTRLIDIHDARLGLIFCNTQRMVDDIADALIARGYSADRLHGGISQTLRTRTMSKFKNSEFDLLVATDVAGRGLDVDDLDMVINFDLPYDGEDYVHRIGRTGRAGRKGIALTLVSGREIYKLQAIERFTRQRMRHGRIPTWDQVEEKRLSGVLDKVRAAAEAGKHNTCATVIDRLLDEGIAATDLAGALLYELLAASGIDQEKPAPADPFARRVPPAPPATAASAPLPEAKPASIESPAATPRPAKPAKPKRPLEAEDVPRAPAPERKKTVVSHPSPPSPSSPSSQPAPAKPSPRSSDPADAPPATRSLSPPAKGYRWIVLNKGKDDGMLPRDVVDAITSDSGLTGKAVGLIKLHPDETYVQVLSQHASDIVDTLDGGQFKGHKLRVRIAHTGATRYEKPPPGPKPFKGKPYSGKGRFNRSASPPRGFAKKRGRW